MQPEFDPLLIHCLSIAYTPLFPRLSLAYSSLIHCVFVAYPSPIRRLSIAYQSLIQRVFGAYSRLSVVYSLLVRLFPIAYLLICCLFERQNQKMMSKYGSIIAFLSVESIVEGTVAGLPRRAVGWRAAGRCSSLV